MHEPCEYFKLPKSNQDNWYPKLIKNRNNDEKNKKKLENDGWKVITVWECQLKIKNHEHYLEKLYHEIIG